MPRSNDKKNCSREKSLFWSALDIESSEERSRFLDSACSDDEPLRRRIDKLLKAAEADDGFLDPDRYEDLSREREILSAALAAEGRLLEASGDDQRVIGEGHEILSEIGRGAMGVVFRARQRSLDREVAVKVILGSALASEGERDRFRAEAESAAALEHAHIVPVYEIGRHGQYDYYTMKLMAGGTLGGLIETALPAPRQAVSLIHTVAETIEATHKHGIIHRDLKPDNVLLDSNGEPHVSDFGLACRLEQPGGLTLTGQILGTPQYMAPEQIGGRSDSATTAVDIYSLGAILYETLSGKPPIRGGSVLTTLQQVKEVTPPLLRSQVDGIDRDLETIVMKCLEKDPAARYESAKALADDLEAWLQHRPIAARPPHAIERTAKWVRRRPFHAAFVATAALLMLVLGVGGPLSAWREARLRQRADVAREVAETAQQTAERERERAVEAALLAKRRAAANRRIAYAAAMRLVETADRFGKKHSLAPQTMLASWRPRPGQKDLRGWEWYYQFGATHEREQRFGHEGRVNALSFSPFGVRFLSSNAGGTTIHNTLNRIISRRLQDGEPHLFSSWSPSGDAVATLGASGAVTLWNPKTARVIARVPHGVTCRSVAWGPAGERLVTIDVGGDLSLWSVGKSIELEAAYPQSGLPLEQIAWSPTGQHLAGIGQSKAVWVWDIDRLDEAPDVYQGHNARVTSLAWQADGTWLATGSADNIVRIWGVPGGDRIVNTSPQGGEAITGIVWNPDGLVLLHAAEGRDEVVLLDLPMSEERPFGQFSGPITAMAWSADAHSVLIGSADGEIVARRDGIPPSSKVMLEHSRGLVDVHWSPDGTGVLCVDEEGRVRVFNAVTAEPKREMSLPPSRDGMPLHAWSPGGSEVAFVDDDRVLILDPKRKDRGGRRHRDREQTLDLGRLRATDVTWTSRGKGLLVSSDNGEVIRFDLMPGRPARQRIYAATGTDTRYEAVSSSPDDSIILATGKTGWLHLWSADTGRLLVEARSDERGRDELEHAWHPDGTHFATGSNRGTVSIWSVAEKRKLLEFEAHRGHLATLAWQPGGRRLATAGKDGDVHLWDWELRQNVLTLPGHRGEVADLDWDPGGRRLASVGWDGTLRVWDATAGLLLSGQTLAERP